MANWAEPNYGIFWPPFKYICKFNEVQLNGFKNDEIINVHCWLRDWCRFYSSFLPDNERLFWPNDKNLNTFQQNILNLNPQIPQLYGMSGDECLKK